MPLPNELLQLANYLANLDLEAHRQANLRRAACTAYYALFHLPVSEATLNWSRPEARSALRRLFEHGKMKRVCNKNASDLDKIFKRRPPDSPELTIFQHLSTIANAFVHAYQERNDAGYETSKEWLRTDMLSLVEVVSAAFNSWDVIRNEPAAQAFLFSLLAKDR